MFSLVYLGIIRKGFDFSTAARGASALLGISEDTARNLLKGGKTVLRTGLEEEPGMALAQKLSDQGLEVVLKDGDQVLQPKVEQPVSHRGARLDAAGPEAVQAVEFTGTAKEYFGIWIVNILLTIVTLGIYSAWAKVRRRRYFYGHTRIAGSGFEYQAEPIKILKGRIIVLVAIGAYFACVHFAPPLIWAWLIFMAFAYPWAAMRSYAFNARYTTYRNVRFAFDGTYGQACKAYTAWIIAAAFSGGLAWPLAIKHQKQYMVEHHLYGQARFKFDAKTGSYYWIVLKAALPLIIAITIGLMMVANHATQWVDVLTLPAYLLAYTFFASLATNLLFNSTYAPDELAFRSNLSVWGYTWIVASNLVVTICTLGLMHPWAAVRMARYRCAHLQVIAPQGLDRYDDSDQPETGALGSEAGDLMDFDFGF